MSTSSGMLANTITKAAAADSIIMSFRQLSAMGHIEKHCSLDYDGLNIM